MLSKSNSHKVCLFDTPRIPTAGWLKEDWLTDMAMWCDKIFELI